mgnify:CR=1 FL=1|jgi:hypothetical protein
MYETLLTEAQKENVEVAEIPFLRVKGLYCDRIIGIKKGMTTTEKACILAEELGHYYTSAGDILDQKHLLNHRQESKARRWGYEKLVPVDKLIKAYEAGVRNRHDLVEFLDVTEEFLIAALKHYQDKYGKARRFRNYVIVFEPLMVFREIE